MSKTRKSTLVADFEKLLLGLACLGVGALGYRYSYHLSRFSEQLDSIGSTTAWDEVEPAVWKELMTRIAFVFVGVFGLFWVLSGLF
ncbi:hypothetical protein SAMN05421858_0678 [Haladaptatus litoreus]|uniref:DUF6199 domain-containing protein n=1 Tax=Haladaptatus litoreus TaxID=553468 RepID=A0A1N6WDH2_9EURY|nr:hypothetical protein SAMN05421858_0678 [Haladaptatus litoreus]